MARILFLQKTPLRMCPLQMMQADIVTAPLEQCDTDRCPERLADGGNIAFEQLILQRLGAGGQHHLAAGKHGGHEIGISLTRAGARFNEASGIGFDRLRDTLGHLGLLSA